MKEAEKRICELSGVKGAKAFILDSVDSTNTEARRLAEKKESTPILILAEHQSAGRGRMGRSFYSPKQTGLYMTALFLASASPADNLLLTTAAAVSTARAIEKCAGIKVDIKWVNDLYLDGKKVCGILCESFEVGGVRYVSVGIGINLSTVDFPDELSSVASSLCVKEEIKTELAAEIFSSLWHFYCKGERDGMIEYYRAHSMVIGRKIVFYEGEDVCRATAVDVDEYGRLAVRLDSGEIKILSSGEITLRLDNGDENEKRKIYSF